MRAGEQVVIDEVQKVPALLDEVHWLIAAHGLHFALCGASARKVRRGAANLLGAGRSALSCTGSRRTRSAHRWTSTGGSTMAICHGCTKRGSHADCSMPMSPTT